MENEEEWRDVSGQPNYEVSNLGRMRRKAQIVHGTPGKHGHVYVGFGPGGGQKKLLMHRLICEAFHGPPPAGKPQCAHLNGDPSDNRPDNLVWATAKENAHHRILHGRQHRGEASPGTKLTEEQVREARLRITNGERYRDIVNDYPVKRETLRDAVNGSTWGHVA